MAGRKYLEQQFSTRVNGGVKVYRFGRNKSVHFSP